MKNMNLPKMSTVKPLYKPDKNTTEECYTNIIKQNFNTQKPNIVWVSDITYIKVSSRFYYLCVIIDLFSRKVVSWHISNKIDTELVIQTFLKAYSIRKPPKELIFHVYFIGYYPTHLDAEFTDRNINKLDLYVEEKYTVDMCQI